MKKKGSTVLISLVFIVNVNNRKNECVLAYFSPELSLFLVIKRDITIKIQFCWIQVQFI